jgi:hypothetical protein
MKPSRLGAASALATGAGSSKACASATHPSVGFPPTPTVMTILERHAGFVSSRHCNGR